MIELQILTPTHWSEAAKLYERAFPPNERRPTGQWRQCMLSQKSFRPYAIVEGGDFCGFITAWELAGFVYVEHFATEPAKRNGGIGGRALELFKSRYSPRPIVLEVELPTDGMAGRRVAFYERHGFTLLGLEYRQPPYRPGGRFLPLQLMSDRPEWVKDRFEAVRADIYRTVYGVQTDKIHIK